MRHVIFRDECFIRSIEENDRARLLCIAHPYRQILLRQRRAGRVIRRAQINDHRVVRRQIGLKAAFLIARQIFEAFIRPAHEFAASARHDIAVHIDRIHRVGDRDDIGFCKDLLHIADIALCAVADKDLIWGNIASAILEIMLRDRFTQEEIALLRTIAAERLHMSHFLDSLLHRFDHDRSQRLRHITNTKGNDIRIWMRGFVRLLLLADFREQVCTLKIQIIFIAMSHKFRLSILSIYVSMTVIFYHIEEGKGNENDCRFRSAAKRD